MLYLHKYPLKRLFNSFIVSIFVACYEHLNIQNDANVAEIILKFMAASLEFLLRNKI